MLKVTGSYTEHDGNIDFSLADTANWHEMAGVQDYRVSVLLFGDETVGPWLSLVNVPPRIEPLPRFPPHGHPTDTFRMAIQGTLTMGRRHYGPGEFRFQEGGRPYGSDDFAWSAEGGQSFVFMADRRGTTLIPTDKALRQTWSAASRGFLEWLGLDPDVEMTEGPAVAVSLGGAGRGGEVEGSFDDVSSWDEVEPGVHVAVGLLGNVTAGPVVLLERADPGRTAFPALVPSTELVHLIVRGSGSIGGRRVGPGDLRIVRAGAKSEPIVAGPEGACCMTIFGDRRGITADYSNAGPLTGPWDDVFCGRVPGLSAELSA